VDKARELPSPASLEDLLKEIIQEEVIIAMDNM